MIPIESDTLISALGYSLKPRISLCVVGHFNGSKVQVRPFFCGSCWVLLNPWLGYSSMLSLPRWYLASCHFPLYSSIHQTVSCVMNVYQVLSCLSPSDPFYPLVNSHITMEITIFKWVLHYFCGHFPCRFLYVYQRVYPMTISH